uniref:(northern house mosquito) hypothetical protein n=1 Tax=Culex pipiens TaxID=7175 RepID=A0A8D8BRE6_CULPI
MFRPRPRFWVRWGRGKLRRMRTSRLLNFQVIDLVRDDAMNGDLHCFRFRSCGGTSPDYDTSADTTVSAGGQHRRATLAKKARFQVCLHQRPEQPSEAHPDGIDDLEQIVLGRESQVTQDHQAGSVPEGIGRPERPPQAAKQHTKHRQAIAHNV